MVVAVSVVTTIMLYSIVVSFSVSLVGKLSWDKVPALEVLRGPQSLPSDLRTRFHCMTMSSWGDVCVYEDMCFDGSTWLLLDPDAGSAGGMSGRRLFEKLQDVVAAARFQAGKHDSHTSPQPGHQALCALWVLKWSWVCRCCNWHHTIRFAATLSRSLACPLLISRLYLQACHPAALPARRAHTTTTSLLLFFMS